MTYAPDLVAVVTAVRLDSADAVSVSVFADYLHDADRLPSPPASSPGGSASSGWAMSRRPGSRCGDRGGRGRTRSARPPLSARFGLPGLGAAKLAGVPILGVRWLRPRPAGVAVAPRPRRGPIGPRVPVAARRRGPAPQAECDSPSAVLRDPAPPSWSSVMAAVRVVRCSYPYAILSYRLRLGRRRVRLAEAARR